MAKKRKTKTRAKAKTKVKSSRRGGKLPAKRCPKPGVMVSTRAGLIGITTGECERRKVDVALMGGTAKLYTKGELRKVPKGQQSRILKELQRPRGSVVKAPRTIRTPRVTRAEVVQFPPMRANRYGEEAARRARSTARYPVTEYGSSQFFDGI